MLLPGPARAASALPALIIVCFAAPPGTGAFFNRLPCQEFADEPGCPGTLSGASSPKRLACVITVSDTRTLETDVGGQIILELLAFAGHEVFAREIVRDQPEPIEHLLAQLASRGEIDAVLLTGGTGLSSRDQTFETVSRILTKCDARLRRVVQNAQLSRDRRGGDAQPRGRRADRQPGRADDARLACRCASGNGKADSAGTRAADRGPRSAEIKAEG